MIGFLILSHFICRHVNAELVDRSGRNINLIPDRIKNTADFSEKWGYPAEEHTVTTSDGYTLSIFRIPYGKTNANRTNRIPILMQHGIYLNSDQLVLRGSHDLPFLLAEEGYDVWISNTRGTRYSKHKRYRRRTFKFWNYSPDELGQIDLKAFIDYILEVTNQPSLAYMGHSRGGTMSIILLSSHPEYNQKVHLLMLVAPVIYSANITSPLFSIAGRGKILDINTFKALLSIYHMPSVFAVPEPFSDAASFLCRRPFFSHFCPIYYFWVNGEGFDNFNYSMMPLCIQHFNDGISGKELIHLYQIAETDKFQMFDYGKDNLKRYDGMTSPPLYDIGKVTTPVYIYYGANDLFISERDQNKFISELPNFQAVFKVPYELFTHLDYFWGLNTNEVFFPKFISDLNEFHKKFK